MQGEPPKDSRTTSGSLSLMKSLGKENRKNEQKEKNGQRASKELLDELYTKSSSYGSLFGSQDYSYASDEESDRGDMLRSLDQISAEKDTKKKGKDQPVSANSQDRILPESYSRKPNKDLSKEKKERNRMW